MAIPARVALFLVLTAVAATVYCQAPLYYSNQNQYFVHGLAHVPGSLLRMDWLAETRDPTPVFSALVTLTVRYLHPWAFYVYFALLIGCYFAAMLSLFRSIVGDEVARRRWPIFLLGLLIVHSAIARWASYRWLGLDFPWYLQAGVAGQYLLGPVLQPSAFGVFLVVGIAQFVRGRPFLAAGCIAVAATLHSTYLLAGALITLGFLTVLALSREYARALRLGGLTLALVLPVVVWVTVTFAPASATTFAEARDILVNFRIPHHCRPDLWLDGIALFQIAWIALGVFLARSTTLGTAMAVAFALGVLLTLLQIMTGNLTLALLFPWRISTVLVPLATTLVLSRLTAIRCNAYKPDAPARDVEFPRSRFGLVGDRVSMVGIALLVVSGMWITATRQGFQSNDDELDVLDFVRREKTLADVYFIPVQVPHLAVSTRGSIKSDFKPLPSKQQDARLIPVDFERFRLPTEAPIYVDFKSIPYADTDVLEWRRRLDTAETIQQQLREARPAAALALLQREGVTHLVWPSGRELRAFWEVLYEDRYYRVYRLPER